MIESRLDRLAIYIDGHDLRRFQAIMGWEQLADEYELIELWMKEREDKHVESLGTKDSPCTTQKPDAD